MLVLSVDCSTSLCCVGLARWAEGELVLLSERSNDDRRQAERLIDLVQQALDDAGASIEGVGLFAVGIGPGTFSGLRVGLATAKGICMATGCELVGVSSLRARARAVASEGSLVVPMVEAYKGEVFAAAYLRQERALIEVVEPFHAEASAALERIGRLTTSPAPYRILGSGVRKHLDVLAPQNVEVLPASFDAPRPRWVAEEGLSRFFETGADSLAELQPAYVRGSDARLPAKKH